MMRELLIKIGSIADEPGDGNETKMRRRILIYAGLLMSCGGILWAVVAMLYGLYWEGIVPLSYAIVTAVNFTYLTYSRKIVIAQNIQISASLILPFAFQAVLGGFFASGGVMLWAILCLIGSLAISSRKQTYFWLLSYITLTIISVALENRLPPPENTLTGILPLGTLFYGMNIITVPSIVFYLTNYFIRGREQAIEELAIKEELVEKSRQLEVSQQALIQSEKLAALGHLTAGIAHEIKNPLNFINNFSETSIELISELNETLKTNMKALGDGVRTEVESIIEDLTTDLGTIAKHGKRADSIIKNMLMHSRSDGGAERMPTDINALVSEAVGLAYHGERAADTNFQVDLQTHLADELKLIVVIPQDISRVLINLLSNAFYATKKRKSGANSEGFVPAVTVTTEAKDDGVEIRIHDNGIGIPQADRKSLFSPFFTTKPAGQGTGLGLSISHDIITKQHDGIIGVNSIEGEGTEFIIWLPSFNADEKHFDSNNLNDS